MAGALVVLIEGFPVMPAPAMRLVPLPDGMLGGRDQANAFYEEVSAQRVEVAAVSFGGAEYLRIAAAPYNTADDYDRLADAVLKVLARWRFSMIAKV